MSFSFPTASFVETIGAAAAVYCGRYVVVRMAFLQWCLIYQAINMAKSDTLSQQAQLLRLFFDTAYRPMRQQEEVKMEVEFEEDVEEGGR